MVSGLFFCVEIDNGDKWLQQDLDIRCWDSTHIKWSLAIGIPSIILWILGIPLLGFYMLYRNRKLLNHREFLGKYKYIYQGLREDCFYWELINMGRKVILISVNVFLNLQRPIFKALLSLLILFLFWQLQKTMNPYKNDIFNKLEQREIFASISIFFGALFFLSPEIQTSTLMGAFILIILLNSFFLLLFAYCIISQFESKHAKFVARILARISLIENELSKFK